MKIRFFAANRTADNPGTLSLYKLYYESLLLITIVILSTYFSSPPIGPQTRSAYYIKLVQCQGPGPRLCDASVC